MLRYNEVTRIELADELCSYGENCDDEETKFLCADLSAMLTPHPAQATIKDGAAQAVAGEVTLAAIDARNKYLNSRSDGDAVGGMQAALAAAYPALTTEIARLREVLGQLRDRYVYRYLRTNRSQEWIDLPPEIVAANELVPPPERMSFDKFEAERTAIRASRGEGL